MINSHWKILQCCLFWVGLIRRMWPYSNINHFSFPLYGRGNRGHSLAAKVFPAAGHCWASAPWGHCSRGLGHRRTESSPKTKLKSLSRPGGPREALKPGEQPKEDALLKAYQNKQKKMMAPEMRTCMMDMAHTHDERAWLTVCYNDKKWFW